MQCKSGYAQAGQNKKRRADARLSWKTKLDYLITVFFSAFFR